MPLNAGGGPGRAGVSSAKDRIWQVYHAGRLAGRLAGRPIHTCFSCFFGLLKNFDLQSQTASAP